MALQGTLDTFELPDVLRLLASTRKTGRLYLRSDRGDGDVWLHDGQVVGIATGALGPGLDDGLFELLRSREGAFAFEPGDEPPAPVEPADVEPLLTEAEAQLEEWREIEAVVPGLDAWVALAPELDAPEITVSADTWRLVATIGSGVTVGELGQVLGLGEVAVCRLVRDVVELGLGAVAAPPAHARTAPAAVPDLPGVPADEDVAEVPPFDDQPVVETSVVADPEPAPIAPAPASVPAVYDPGTASGYALAYEPAPEPAAPLFADSPFAAMPVEPEPAASSPFGASQPRAADDDEVARQLAMLSPRAAQAVAAAAAVDPGRDADGPVADDGEEPVNRGLLLKFLSSVKT